MEVFLLATPASALEMQVEGGEDEPKKYKKANLGLANEMYYNDEVRQESSTACPVCVLPTTLLALSAMLTS